MQDVVYKMFKIFPSLFPGKLKHNGLKEKVTMLDLKEMSQSTLAKGYNVEWF